MPSDDSMLDYFNLYETNFEKLKDIAVKYDDFHYPPYNETDGRTDMIVSDDYEELDSLLKEINIALILSVDSTEVYFLLHRWGLSISGGYKEYVYSSKLADEFKRCNEECIMNYGIERFIVKRIAEEDLDQVAQ